MLFKKFLKNSTRLLDDANRTFWHFHKKVNKIKEKIKTEEEEQMKEIKVVSKEPKESVLVVFSVNSVAKSTLAVIGILVLVYFLYLIKNILLIFLISLFLASVFNPGVDFFERYKIPRPLGLIILYILVFALLTFLIGSLVPIIIEQITDIASNLSGYVNNLFNGNTKLPFDEEIMPYFNELWSSVDRQQIVTTIKKSLETIGSQLGNWTGNALGAILTVSAGILNMVMVFFITFFIVIDNKNLHKFFLSLFPSKHGAYLSQRIHTIQEKIGDWIRGQLLLGISMGIITFIAFWILGIKYATTLAIISAISEFIPYVGPLITFSSAALIAINQSTGTFLWLILVYVIIQTIEGNILVPLIMSRSVGINPIIVILAMLIGWQFLGILGMIIAIPVAKIISLFVEDYRGKIK